METVSRSVPFKVVRAAEDGDGLTLTGYAAVFNSPTQIRGEIPALFDEVIAPGAFRQTIRSKTPVLQFDHGQNPHIGSIPIGQITELREDGRGLFVEARLFDNDLVKPIRDAIAGGAIQGMSFRFSVPEGKDEWDRSGEIPLRTIHEVRCIELGPVVFPAYQDTLVGVRDEGSDVLDQARDFLAALDVETRTALFAEFSSEEEETETAEPAVDEPDTREEAAEGTSDIEQSEAQAEQHPDSTRLHLSVAAAELALLELTGVSNAH